MRLNGWDNVPIILHAVLAAALQLLTARGLSAAVGQHVPGGRVCAARGGQGRQGKPGAGHLSLLHCHQHRCCMALLVCVWCSSTALTPVLIFNPPVSHVGLMCLQPHILLMPGNACRCTPLPPHPEQACSNSNFTLAGHTAHWFAIGCACLPTAPAWMCMLRAAPTGLL